MKSIIIPCIAAYILSIPTTALSMLIRPITMTRTAKKFHQKNEFEKDKFQFNKTVEFNVYLMRMIQDQNELIKQFNALDNNTTKNEQFSLINRIDHLEEIIRG